MTTIGKIGFKDISPQTRDFLRVFSDINPDKLAPPAKTPEEQAPQKAETVKQEEQQPISEKTSVENLPRNFPPGFPDNR